MLRFFGLRTFVDPVPVASVPTLFGSYFEITDCSCARCGRPVRSFHATTTLIHFSVSVRLGVTVQVRVNMALLVKTSGPV